MNFLYPVIVAILFAALPLLMGKYSGGSITSGIMLFLGSAAFAILRQVFVGGGPVAETKNLIYSFFIGLFVNGLAMYFYEKCYASPVMASISTGLTPVFLMILGTVILGQNQPIHKYILVAVIAICIYFLGK